MNIFRRLYTSKEKNKMVYNCLYWDIGGSICIHKSLFEKVKLDLTFQNLIYLFCLLLF